MHGFCHSNPHETTHTHTTKARKKERMELPLPLEDAKQRLDSGATTESKRGGETEQDTRPPMMEQRSKKQKGWRILS